jgi:hypothetical protein
MKILEQVRALHAQGKVAYVLIQGNECEVGHVNERVRKDGLPAKHDSYVLVFAGRNSKCQVQPIEDFEKMIAAYLEDLN